jgi:hypothetical protein
MQGTVSMEKAESNECYREIHGVESVTTRDIVIRLGFKARHDSRTYTDITKPKLHS